MSILRCAAARGVDASIAMKSSWQLLLLNESEILQKSAYRALAQLMLG